MAKSSRSKISDMIQQAMMESQAEDGIYAPPRDALIKATSASVEKAPSHSKALANVYMRFEITPQAVADFPNVTGTFPAVGGIGKVLEYLKSSNSKEARAILNYYSMYESKKREIIPFEAYLVAAKCTRKQFMQILIGEVSEQSNEEAVLLSAANHGAVVQTTIDIALDRGDDNVMRAQEILHKNRGFLPTPKTQSVSIYGNVNQDNRVNNSQNATIKILELEKGNDSISTAMDVFNAKRADYIEGDVVDE